MENYNGNTCWLPLTGLHPDVAGGMDENMEATVERFRVWFRVRNGLSGL